MIVLKNIYDFLRSVKLAIVLLILILLCCLIGVTLLPPQVARALIFSSLWFNALLVLLILNVSCYFFGRIWRKKLTLVSLGMILFHLSFVSIFVGVVYNSLFYFSGVMRLTEGETLPNGQPQSYDFAEWGRFFKSSKLRGETMLIGVQKHYKVKGADKGMAYEIIVGEGDVKKRAVIYITKNLEYNGFRYFRDKEGYSLLIIVYDKQGRELYGAHVPLQSLKQKDGTYLYTTGTASEPGSFPFPQDPMQPLFELQVAYRPEQVNERDGYASFQIWPRSVHSKPGASAITEGGAAVGGKFDAGDYYLSVKEVRYWVGMSVRYDPGLPIIMTSLWIGLAGMILTTIGRLMQRSKTQAGDTEGGSA